MHGLIVSQVLRFTFRCAKFIWYAFISHLLLISGERGYGGFSRLALTRDIRAMVPRSSLTPYTDVKNLD